MKLTFFMHCINELIIAIEESDLYAGVSSNKRSTLHCQKRNTSEVSRLTHHVSWLLNFLVTTLPSSIPNRSTIFCARSTCDVPLNTLMLGILLSVMNIFSTCKMSAALMRLLSVRGGDQQRFCQIIYVDISFTFCTGARILLIFSQYLITHISNQFALSNGCCNVINNFNSTCNCMF